MFRNSLFAAALSIVAVPAFSLDAPDPSAIAECRLLLATIKEHRARAGNDDPLFIFEPALRQCQEVYRNSILHESLKATGSLDVYKRSLGNGANVAP